MDSPITRADAPDSYDRDFHAWTEAQAALLRGGRIAEADVHNIAEEIEALGRRARKELVSHLAVLLLHLLKWQHQPERRGRSWRYTIEEQRREILDLLTESPSLRSFETEAVARAYDKATLRAERETLLPRELFPWVCPYTFDQVLDMAFWPEPA